MKLRTIVDGIEHFLTQGGAKVRCDQCRDYYDVGIRWKTKEQRARLVDELRQEGWVVKGDHEYHVCPACVGSRRPFSEVVDKLASGKSVAMQPIGDSTRLGCGCFDAHYVDAVHGPVTERGRCGRHLGIFAIEDIFIQG